MDIFAGYAKPWVHRLLMSFIGAYVENLSPDQLSVGINNGNIDLRDLRLKNSVLDKLGLPFSVVEGRIGRFMLSINWAKKETPVTIEIEDVQVLIAASSATEYSRDDEDMREQQLKMEHLERAEAMRMGEITDSAAASSSYFDSFVARIVNNVQIKIKNIHVRYEDKQTVPAHPFSIGVTLASLSAISVDENWKPKYLDASEQSIHKLVSLDSLAVYFNTDSESIAGLPYDESMKLFRDLIPSEAHSVDHQYILRPVSGEGRIILNKQWGKNGLPHYIAQLLFNELGFILDNHQYRDVISLADEYHIFARQHKYRRYRPDDSEFNTNKAKALWEFATTAIREEVHDKNKRWTWDHFRTRRDDRHRYVELFKQKELANPSEEIANELAELEKKLSYNDIRFYRSIARSQLRRDKDAGKILEQNKKKQQSWSSWLWGSSSDSSPKLLDQMTEEERKGLNEFLDYDEKAELAESFDPSRETISAVIKLHLKQGSLRLKQGPSQGSGDIVSLVFDSFNMNGIQRHDNFEAALSLGNFRVFDGTTTNQVYRQIVHVKDGEDPDNGTSSIEALSDTDENAFFYMKYEYKPLDERADNGLVVKLRSMEILYQRGYVEAVVEFFRPPESQLQSVEALLNVAGETLGGIQRETRAGLEYALETHKTVDLHLDMHAPIIIIPESVTAERSKHLVIDAGRVLVESALASKETIREIEKKRKTKYTDDDYRQLESMMYDNYSVKLIAAQFVIGNSLDDCRRALQSEEPDPRLHVLERVNIDLLAQNSIVPSARNIARFKMSGRLPNLHVNFSDSKYKTLMHLIDVALPRFGDDSIDSTVSQPASQVKPTFQPSVNLFGSEQAEYVVDDTSIKEPAEETETLNVASKKLSDIRQHQFELSFRVDSLSATMSRTVEDGSERPLGNLILDHFLLKFAMAKYEMKVDIDLKAINLKSSPPGLDPLLLVSTESEASDANLMNIAYRRAQKASPDFISIYDGYDQSVDVKLTTFVLRSMPEHVLALYDYIMSTFVPSNNGSGVQLEEEPTHEALPGEQSQTLQSPDRIRVRSNLAEFQVLLLDNGANLATLSLSTANVDVDLRESGMVVVARLGKLQLTDNSSLQTKSSEFKQLLSIEGDEFAELRYETFSAAESIKKGINSTVDLTTGSLKLHFLETPLNSMYFFLLKFARLKGIYDAAAEAAVQQAAKIERMGFRLIIRSPIVVFPVEPTQLDDAFVLELGELSAQNRYEGPMQFISASLSGIRLKSAFYVDSKAEVKIIDDVNVSMEVVQSTTAELYHKAETPEFKVKVDVSEVRLQLTEQQYCRLIKLSQTVPGVFAGSSQIDIEAPKLHQDARPTQVDAQTDLLPELSPILPSSGQPALKKVDLVLSMHVVNLHLYDAGALYEGDFKDHGIANFTLSGTTVTLDMRMNGALQGQLWIKSFTMNNTRPGPTKFREIIPAADHGRDQFHCLFTSSGGAEAASQVVATVDSPQIIFSVEPIYALFNFFSSAFNSVEDSQVVGSEPSADSAEVPARNSSDSQLNFRFDLYDAMVSLLEDDHRSDTQAIRLSLAHLSLSKQNALVLDLSRLGMSLTRMNKQADTVRFLDDIDIKLASESRSDWNRQFIGINIAVEQEIVFRTSYRDMLLIQTIVNKAATLFLNSDDTDPSVMKQAAFDNAANAVASRSKTEQQRSSYTLTRQSRTTSKSNLRTKVIMTTEELEASLKGFRVVFIDDLHEAPVIHFASEPFSLTLTDWSSQLHARTILPLTVSYWNLKNSHWEPLIDPWSITISVHRIISTGRISLDISSIELLDLNISATFVELAIATLNVWNKEGDLVLKRARGSYAPYRICNRTGVPVYVWPDSNDNANIISSSSVKIDQGSTIDWRFDDWKKMREDGVSSGANSIGIRLDTKPWEALRSVPVDREGMHIYSLRPRTKTGYGKLMCEIVTKDNVKFITIRSTYKVENQTFYPLEITLVDDTGHPVYPIEKIVPGDNFVLPVEAVVQNRIRIQPDAGFGYKWCQPIKWEDLREVKHINGLTIRCPHMDRKEAPFHFLVSALWNSHTRDYPQLTLNLRAPIELENLLPFDIQYKIYDKDTNHNWNSFLRKGGNTPVHSVELSHLVLLSVKLQDTVYEASDFTIINADKRFEFDQEYQLSLPDPRGRRLNLMLNYIKFPDSGGAFKVQVYCPFIVVNKTGLPFSVKCVRSAGMYKEVPGPMSKDELASSTPFLLSHTNKKGNEFIFKVGDSSWSQVIRLDAPSAEIAMVIPHMNQKSEIHVGLSWSEGVGKYKLTKVIELTPRFFVYNKLARTIRFREIAAPPSGHSELNSGERAPLQFMRVEERRLLRIAYPGLDAQWYSNIEFDYLKDIEVLTSACRSAPVDMEAIGTAHVRMSPAGSTTKQDTHLIDINVILEKAMIFVVLSDHDGAWPFMIENKSSYEVSIGQVDEARERPDSDFVYKIQVDSRLPYAWDFPAMAKKKLYISCNKRARKIDIMEIGVLPPLRHNSGAVALDIRAEGPSQLLTISDYREETSIYKPRRRNTGESIARSDSMASTLEFEAVQEDVPPTLSVNLDLKGLGISLLNKRLIEVVYVSAQNLKLEYHNSPVAQSINVSFGSLQIDNQLHDAYFPVLLQPTPIPREERSLGALPTVQVSVIILNDSAHGIFFVKYTSILLQALTIQIDEEFLYAIIDLIKLEGIDWEKKSEDVLIRDADKSPEPTPPQPGQDVYFEVLELQPIILSLSFVRNITSSDGDSQAISTSGNPLAFVLNALSMALANAEGVELVLNALGITDVRLSLPELQSRIMYHYRQEVLRQIYLVLGSADLIGNPVGLFTNVSSGVADIFYEPWHGVVQHGGGELGIGIAKGAASFAKKTIFGLSDSMTKITSSIGKGISAATLDADFQAKRRMNQRRNKPRHALIGVASGAEALANSVASGVEGVLMKPLEGADAEGPLGFFKGVGKGFVGVVTKPVVGVFDLAANVAEGIRNTTTVFDAPQRDRVRKPRHVPADGVLQPYNPRKAIGQSWMRDLQDGIYRKDFYIAHIDLLGTDNIVLLTNARVVSFSSRGLQMHWEMPLTSIAGVQGEQTGIRFVSKAGRDHDRFVIIQDAGSKEWFFEQVKAVVMSFNARRRLER